MSICIIPARSGSTRIPGKNIKLFHGKPIIAYSIETAKESGLFDQIIVSSDHTEIIDIAMEYGATDYHDRSDEMAANEVGTQEVVKDVLLNLEITKYVCCIYPTAPLMSVNDLKHGEYVLNDQGYLEYAFSVGINPLCDAGQFYWGWARAFLDGVPLIDSHTAMIPIAPERVCDINTMDDWERAERMYESL